MNWFYSICLEPYQYLYFEPCMFIELVVNSKNNLHVHCPTIATKYKASLWENDFERLNALQHCAPCAYYSLHW